jgi:hypothetical protein
MAKSTNQVTQWIKRRKNGGEEAVRGGGRDWCKAAHKSYRMLLISAS